MTEEKDIFLTIRERFESDEEYEEYIEDIFLICARARFGKMLNFLCEKALLSQNELGKRAKKYREELKKRRPRLSKITLTAVDQSEVSRVIYAKKQPSYLQIFIWFRMLKERLKSEAYAKACEKVHEPVFVLTREFEDDMWHLAGYGTPREVVTVYEKHKETIY